MTHGFIELAGNIHAARSVKASDIERIEITMAPVNFLLIGDPTSNKIHPSNNIDAQFSAYHKLQDPEIRSLCGKSIVKTDAAMEGFAAVLKMEWSDGTVEESSMRYPLGEVQNPFTRDKIDEKFMSLAEPVYGKEKARAIVDLIDDLENHTIEELFRLLR